MENMENTVIISRHPAFRQFCIEQGLATEETPVIAHATPEQVRGRNVIGNLPLSLAALAESVTEIPLALTPEMRGRELDIETMRQIAGAPVRYVISRI